CRRDFPPDTNQRRDLLRFRRPYAPSTHRPEGRSMFPQPAKQKQLPLKRGWRFDGAEETQEASASPRTCQVPTNTSGARSKSDPPPVPREIARDLPTRRWPRSTLSAPPKIRPASERMAR